MAMKALQSEAFWGVMRFIMIKDMSRSLVLLIFFLVLGFSGRQAWAFTGFHPAATEAEKTVAKIIKAAQDDPAVPNYLLRGKGLEVGVLKEIQGMFTPALLRAFREAEANMVHEHCGVSYIAGEQCGIRYNPVTCLDFERNEYVFRTDSGGEYHSGEYNAVIAYRLSEGQQIIATFNMLKVGSHWKLDGVDCAIGDSFNM